MTTTVTEAPVKPDVLDSKGTKLELGIRVKVLGEKYLDDEGKPKLGTVTGIEYQRKRTVIAVDGERKIVRPATQTWVVKNKSGKVQFDAAYAAKRTAKAERAVMKAAKAAAAEAAPAAE